MNMASFDFSLRKNCARYNGPFNWLASGDDLATFKLLSSQDKRSALTKIYHEQFKAIDWRYNGIAPIERLYTKPAVLFEIFQFIQCTELVRIYQAAVRPFLVDYSVGDFRLPLNKACTVRLILHFDMLKKDVAAPQVSWVAECVNAFGADQIFQWIDRQIGFLKGRAETLKEPLPAIENRLPSISITSKIVSSNIPAAPPVPPALPDDKSYAGQKAWSPLDTVESIRKIDLETITIGEAHAALGRLAGMTEVKTRINDLIAARRYHEARAAALGKQSPPAFHNFILSGPPGVGKTTVATCAAGLLAAHGFLKKKRLVFASGTSLIGAYSGVTEERIDALFAMGKGGVIVIDEADSLAKDTSYKSNYDVAAINAITAFIGYEKDANSGTVLILTGYDKGMERLLDNNEGLRRRFPNQISIPPYDGKAVESVLASMLTQRGYRMTELAIEKACGQILAAKDHLGARFGNAGTIEEMIQVMETGHIRKFSVEKWHELAGDAHAMDELSLFDQWDVPKFDKKSKTFQTEALYLISSRKEGAGR